MSTPESVRLAEALRRTVSGPVWHGDALEVLLGDVSVRTAVARPIGGAHSIWELVLHITSWADIARARLAPEATNDPDDRTDWPPVGRPTASRWGDAIQRMSTSYRGLAAATALLMPADLARRVPGRHYTVRTMLHGVVEHGAYHGGQIALLKRAASPL
jgi:uncharacterized damage-inducible protein DinB